MIEAKRNFVVLELSPDLYDRKSIREAAREFGRKIKVEFRENFIVKIPKESGAKKTAYEFGNLVLKIMKGMGAV